MNQEEGCYVRIVTYQIFVRGSKNLPLTGVLWIVIANVSSFSAEAFFIFEKKPQKPGRVKGESFKRPLTRLAGG